jgi:acyl carrier protein
MNQSTVNRLKTIISEELDVNLKPDDIDADASLLEGGIEIDSIAIVELIAIVEEKFSILFDDDDLVPESFSTVNNLANVVNAKLT